MHRPEFRKSDGRSKTVRGGHRKSAGDAGKTMTFKMLEVVARGGIEPPTRGFSVRRRARLGARIPKTGNEFSRERPNRPARPSPSRTGTPESRRSGRELDPRQR